MSSHVGRLGHFMAACAMYGTMLRFFTVNHKEVSFTVVSFTISSFNSKIILKLLDELFFIAWFCLVYNVYHFVLARL